MLKNSISFLAECEMNNDEFEVCDKYSLVLKCENYNKKLLEFWFGFWNNLLANIYIISNKNDNCETTKFYINYI